METVIMHFKNLKVLFDHYGSHVKLDNRLANELIQFNQHLLTKNSDHIEFFGGMLVGTNRLIMAKSDFNYFFDEVVDMDQLGIKDDIKNTDGVDTRLSISTDPYSNVCFWLVHKSITDKNASSAQRKKVATEALIAMHLRFMTQLQWKYFPHLADRQVAQRALNSLNNRYDLKVYGSWYETIKARCDAALDPQWKHFKQFTNIENADEVRKMINRLKGGIEQIFKKQANIFYDHHKEGEKVASLGAMFEGEDGKELKPLRSDFADQRNYLMTIITDKSSFIKPQLIEVISGLVSIHTPTFEEGLAWLSDNATYDKKIDQWLEDVLVHAREHTRAQEIGENDLPAIMQSLRNAYTSSQTTNRDLLDNKEKMDKWLKKIIDRKLHKNVPNARTGLMLYVVLRIMTRNYF